MWRVREAGLINMGDTWNMTLTAATGALGIFIAVCVAQTNSLFAADSWHNVTFTAGEVKNPSRNLPLSLAMGTLLVITLYLLANLAYLAVLTFKEIQNAPEDRVASQAMDAMFKGSGAMIMAAAIMVSTFGCNNGLILAGSRLLYAMSLDNLFFRGVKRLNSYHVPATALILQGIWAACLVLPRTIKEFDNNGNPIKFGSLYNNLRLRHLGGVDLLHPDRPWIFRVRTAQRPRPYRAFGYLASGTYILGRWPDPDRALPLQAGNPPRSDHRGHRIPDLLPVAPHSGQGRNSWIVNRGKWIVISPSREHFASAVEMVAGAGGWCTRLGQHAAQKILRACGPGMVDHVAGCSFFDVLATGQDHDAVGRPAGEADFVGDHHDGEPLREILDDGEHLVLSSGSSELVISSQSGRGAMARARACDSLFLSPEICRG